MGHESMPTPADLSARLRIALDRAELRRGGEPVQFPEVEKFLTSRGVSISRGKWMYVLRGSDIRTQDRAMLEALSELLEVPEDYFYTGELSSDLEKDVDLVAAMRAAKVQNFAARVLGDLAPEAVAAISKVLEEIQRERTDE